MSIERTERVHQHATQDGTLTVSKVRQGYPTDDMSRVVVTVRKVSVAINREPAPGLSVPVGAAYLDPENARDIGLAITQAADELLAEQAKDDKP